MKVAATIIGTPMGTVMEIRLSLLKILSHQKATGTMVMTVTTPMKIFTPVQMKYVTAWMMTAMGLLMTAANIIVMTTIWMVTETRISVRSLPRHRMDMWRMTLSPTMTTTATMSVVS